MTIKHEQRLADIKELLNLVLESTNRVGTMLDTTDNNLNEMGGTVVELGRAILEMDENVSKQHENLQSVVEGQSEVNTLTKEFINKLNESLEQQGNTKSTLDIIAEALLELEDLNEAQHNEIITKISESNDNYTTAMVRVNEKLDVLHTTIDEITYEECFNRIDETLVNMDKKAENMLSNLNDQERRVSDKMSEILSRLQEVVVKVDKLNKASEEIAEDFETATARINKIDLKLGLTE